MPNSYEVGGVGITCELRKTLETDLHVQFPSYSVRIIDAERMTENLSAHICETKCDPRNGKWDRSERASCELILCGQQLDREETGYYCVTAAHLLMTNDESLWFENEECANSKLEELRKEVLLRKDCHSHRLQLQQQQQLLRGLPAPAKIWLPGMPMLGYRVFISDPTKKFQNDIVLFALEDFNTLNDNFNFEIHKTHKSLFCLSKYKRKLLNDHNIDTLTGVNIYVREYRGIIVPPRKSFPDDALGQHISFTLYGR